MMRFSVFLELDCIKFYSAVDEVPLAFIIDNSKIGHDNTNIMYFATALFHLYQQLKDYHTGIAKGVFIFDNETYNFLIHCDTGNITSNSLLLSKAIEKVDTLPILIRSNNTPSF